LLKSPVEEIDQCCHSFAQSAIFGAASSRESDWHRAIVAFEKPADDAA
jgi:hypothetical protein